MEAFRTELRRIREERGWSRRHLAELMPVDQSYISHIEAGRHRPTESFASRADEVLHADGSLRSLYEEFRSARVRRSHEDAHTAGQMIFHTALWVDEEVAEQRYDGESYTMVIRRNLYNVGHEPILQYFVRVNFDQSPDDNRRAVLDHHPGRLTWDEVELSANCQGEEMIVEPVTDQDALKEAWLLFRNSQCSFPLYPGGHNLIEYTYRVPAEKWGFWFQRAIRLPTRQLAIQLIFPVEFTPHRVWGTEMSMMVRRRPLGTPVQNYSDGKDVYYRWETTYPPLSARYRLEWAFAHPAE